MSEPSYAVNLLFYVNRGFPGTGICYARAVPSFSVWIREALMAYEPGRFSCLEGLVVLKGVAEANRHNDLRVELGVFGWLNDAPQG